jgi:NhaP-type Na+/H+ or K+/H+ antiporter
MMLISFFILMVFLYSLFSKRIEKTVITAPILFCTAGMLIYFYNPVKEEFGFDMKTLLKIAEIGLVMTLFTDATHINRKILKRNKYMPVRLLTTGLLLTLLLGTLAAMVIFTQLSIWEAGILAAILAPTDAGLGQVIVNSPRVPERIRQSLNVEAGLNDGISVPFLMFFIALSLSSSQGAGAVLTRFVFEQLGLGTLVGLVIGLFGGMFLNIARRKDWMTGSMQQLGLIALPFFCVLISEPIGASMFIAAFVAGLAVQIKFKEAVTHSVEFTEGWGQLLNYFVFFLFGMFVVKAWGNIDYKMVIYAIVSLTIVRMIPVAIALAGTRLSKYTVIFMGWFGPRGLASIVLGLVYLEQETNTTGESIIRLAVLVTVLFSIFAHGFSTLPGINLYVRKMAGLDEKAPEKQVEISE